MLKPSYASRVPPRVLRAHVILGALQVTVGCLVIALGIASLTVGSWPGVAQIGSGVWAGPFFIIAGVSGIVAGKSSKRCTLGCVVTCLVFSIIASIMGFILIIAESLITATNLGTYEVNKAYYKTWCTSYPTDEPFNAYYAISIVCTVLFAFEFVLAIVHAAFACRASCCCVQRPPQLTSQQQQQQLEHQQYQQQMFMGQPVVYSGQPPVAQLVTFPAGQQVVFMDSGAANQGQQQLVTDSAGQQVTYWTNYEIQPSSNPSFTEVRPPPYETGAHGSAGVCDTK